MATSRDPSQFGRKRSNTAQSSFRSISTTHPTLKLGDSKLLNAWVHDNKDNPNVVFNQCWWPGVADGDLLRVSGRDLEMEDAFLFTVPKDEGCPKPQLQARSESCFWPIIFQIVKVDLCSSSIDIYTSPTRTEIRTTKPHGRYSDQGSSWHRYHVDPGSVSADYVELTFQYQYLGRNEMWRLGKSLAGQCIYAGQDVSFVGGIVARIETIYIGNQKVSSAYMTTKTNAIYRSLSARITIFIQVCRELWEFAGDGERYNEKIIHSFLPALFAKWREAGTNHTVTIVLISRVYYDESEIDYAAGPLRKDDLGNWYKDFFKVITDLEVIHEWKPTLINLKDSFWDFQRDILLTHHYHNATRGDEGSEANGHGNGNGNGNGAPSQVRLVGTISCAQDGPILEALNLGLNPTETHYIDRSLNLTGAATIIISPGTGYFRVSKRLLRLTTTRMLDQGFLLDLILLTKPPLHQSPIFSFQGYEPSGGRSEKDEKLGKDSKSDPFLRDPLWGGDGDQEKNTGPKKTYWWEPFWISTTFWGLQMDLPFRQDRFIASAKMHEIQMLGLLEHDVLSTIEVPYLPERRDHGAGPVDESGHVLLTKDQADAFDQETFALTSQYAASTTTSQTNANSTRTVAEKRASQRNSTLGRITTIEESPKRIHRELPPENIPVTAVSAVTATGLGSSPSQVSLRSNHSDKSSNSLKSVSRSGSISKGTLASKLTPSWLFNPFRGAPSEPQTTQVSASATPPRPEKPSSEKHSNDTRSGKDGSHSSGRHHHHQHGSHPSNTPPSAPIRMPGKHTSPSAMQPMAIKSKAPNRSALSRTYEEETLMPHRTPYSRRSPINTPPRDEILASKRRSLSSALGPAASIVSSIPSANPNRPRNAISYPQVSLASRWQHLFPTPLYKHDLKWTSIVTPGCLPLTVEHFPSMLELETAFDVFSYEFIVDPSEMRSFLVKPPTVHGNSEEVRKAWALVVMRGMAAVRLAQGFQFIIRSRKPGGAGVGGGGGGGGSSFGTDGKGGGFGSVEDESKPPLMRRNKSFAAPEEESIPLPGGAAEVLMSTTEPVYLSMSNEIHCISYTGEVINVKRYVRRMTPSKPFEYQCLIWPKLGGGYTQLTTQFSEHGLENYGWNRLDMLVAGYEHHFNESLRYWRTRFIIIPTAEPPHVKVGPSGENLNHEEARILGTEKLAEQFTKLRWQPPAEKIAYPPVRFLPTTLGPIMSVLDDSLMDQLDQIHAAGPLKKKVNSPRVLGEMPLHAIAKAMKEEDGVPIKFYQWHKNQYPNSFIGYDFVSWLIREFRDVSNRTQATEWGVRLLEQGLFEHCRGYHGFLDGHYYYRLKGEYSIPMTPRYTNWFSGRRNTDDGPGVNPFSQFGQFKQPRTSGARKKQLILSQTMVIDIDQHKRSDQAECVILHHDIIHNPATVFHFELQWIGTTARCIEDQLRVWNRSIERYGLKLVEAYVTQISDIRQRSAFQSCFPMRLALEPPVIPDIDLRLPEGTQSKRYFEYAILQKFGFILDVEAADFYPSQVDVVYSYRRSPYQYSQFVHRSGVAFIQVIGGTQGFLFLTNRLMTPVRGSMKSKDNNPSVAAEAIRVEMTEFCEDESKLRAFYEEQVALLPPVPTPTEEPPPLAI